MDDSPVTPQSNTDRLFVIFNSGMVPAFTFPEAPYEWYEAHASKAFSDAAAEFQKSHDFFEKHPSIDKYRFITMFSSNAIPYQQMALNNMGICYLQMGEDAKALDAFTKLAELNGNYPHISKTIETIQKHIDETASR